MLDDVLYTDGTVQVTEGRGYSFHVDVSSIGVGKRGLS
jgi:hypothetical protein